MVSFLMQQEFFFFSSFLGIDAVKNMTHRTLHLHFSVVSKQLKPHEMKTLIWSLLILVHKGVFACDLQNSF